MKFPKQAELEQLVSKIQQQQALSAEELQSFAQLNAELASWKTDCVKVIDEIAQQIVRYGITLEQLSAREELRHWARPLAAAASPGRGQEPAEGEDKKRRQRTPNPELVIFRIQPPGAKGAATLIHRNELPQKLGAKLQWLLEQEGELKDKLMGCIDSKEAEQYLVNEEGQLFLDKLVNWIRAQAV
ncbi:MAG: hypothetical protein RLZZ555_7 [Pseudomonadota bacterium]